MKRYLQTSILSFTVTAAKGMYATFAHLPSTPRPTTSIHSKTKS